MLLLAAPIEHKAFAEEIPVKDDKFEMVINLIPIPMQTLPDPIKLKNNQTNNQLSNSFASYNSFNGLEVDEGEDRTHPLKLFFQE